MIQDFASYSRFRKPVFRPNKSAIVDEPVFQSATEDCLHAEHRGFDRQTTMVGIRLPPDSIMPVRCFGGHGVTALPCALRAYYFLAKAFNPYPLIFSYNSPTRFATYVFNSSSVMAAAVS